MIIVLIQVYKMIEKFLKIFELPFEINDKANILRQVVKEVI